MSKCKSCKGFNAGIGDYCPKCIQEASHVNQRIADNVPHIKVDVTHKPDVTNSVTHILVDVTRRCKCGRPRVKWSHSYCRDWEAKRIKAWRHTI